MGLLNWRGLGKAKSKKVAPGNRGSFAARGHRLHLEPLERRQMLSVTLATITGPDTGGVYDIPAGKDLYVPLTGTDTGQTISYSATSNNPSVQVSILNGNPTLEMTVTGTQANGQSFSGTMTIELFPTLAPNTTSKIEGLVNSGFYNGLTFYRIVPGFVIQAGANNSSQPAFNDEFNSQLTFNSPGMLAMANAGPNTNSSEIFITDIGQPLTGTSQFLDYNYSVFGQLTSGFSTYNNVMNAIGVTKSTSKPTSPVTITSATIINDTQNGVLQISEPNGFTGTANITVTATGTDSTTAQQTFGVSVAPPTAASGNAPVVLAPVANEVTTAGEAVTFQLTAQQVSSSGTMTFSVTDNDGFTTTPTNVTVQVTPGANGTATIKLTPANGFTGTVELLAHVDDSINGGTYHDALPFSLTVQPALAINSVTNPINAANAASTSVSGVGTAGASLTLVANNGSSTSTTYHATIGSDNTWTIPHVDVSSLPDGTITFTATSVDTSSKAVTANSTATKDTLVPSVTLSTVTNPIILTNDKSTTATGTGEAGTTIKVTATDGTTTTSVFTGTVANNGTWTITGIDVSGLIDGPITYSATATDAAGNISSPVTLGSIKDTVPANIAISTATSPITLANVKAASVTGTSDALAKISLTATDGTNTTSAFLATADSNGNWTIGSIDLSSLKDGTITYNAIATNAIGNTANAQQTAPKATVAVTVVTNPINANNANNVTVSGTGEIGATVAVTATVGGQMISLGSTTIGAGGTWLLDALNVSSLPDGTVTFTATATDDLNNSATSSMTATKDTVAPAVGITSVTNPVNSLNAAGTTVNGTGEANAGISLVVSDGTTNSSTYTATVNAQGNWTITGVNVTSLKDGMITYTATATDAAGNSATANMNSTKDTVAPAVSITSVTNPINIGNAKTTTATGTAEVNAKISVVASDGTKTSTALTTTADANGNWTITALDTSSLADGTITYTATATDAAGNSAHTSMTSTKTTVALTLVTSPVSQANETNTSASGTGQVGASISVTATDGTTTTTAVTGTISNSGTWSVSGINVSSLKDGTITYTVTATDSSSNTATSSKTTNKDTTPPVVAITAVTSPIVAGDVTAVVARGTGEPNATISLVLTDGTHSTSSLSTTVASDGTWLISGINASSLNDGTVTFTATATDAAGNSGSTSATTTKTALNTASLSGFVYVANKGNSPQSGIAVPGVILTLNGFDTQNNPLPSQTTVTASNGSYHFANLPAGNYSITKDQPAGLLDGSPSAGSLGGVATTDQISTIIVGSGANGTNYNFTEHGLPSAKVSIRYFFASAPPAQQTVSSVVNSSGPSDPVVTSISKGQTDPSSASTVTFNVNFDESVTGVGTTDFSVVPSSSISGAIVSSVTGSGSAYVVTVNTGTGSGTLGLNVVDNDSIVSATGVALGGVGAANGNFVGPSYTIDKAVVAISSVTNPVNASNATSTTATGTGEANASVVVTATDGTNTTSSFTTTVSSSGSWTVSGIDVSKLTDGPITYTAKLTDSLSQTATATLNSTKDTVAPTISITNATGPINALNVSGASVGGTSSANASISVTATDGTNTTAASATTADASGNWSVSGINVSTLVDGNVTYSATASDTAGNSTTVTKAVNKDTVPPSLAISSVTNPINSSNETGVTASGTTDPGATVSVTATDGTTTTNSFAATVDGLGNWNVSGINVSTLKDGSITITATATDSAGNITQKTLSTTKNTT